VREKGFDVSGKSPAIRTLLGSPRGRNPRRAFSTGKPGEMGESVKSAPRCCPNSVVAYPSRHIRGNRDEETAHSHSDRRVVHFLHFIRGKGTGAGGRRRAWRAVRRRGSGTCGRGGGCVHWIRGGAVDRAFLGNSALRIIIPGSTRGTEGFRHTRAADGNRERTAADPIRRVPSGQTKRASGKTRHATGPAPGVMRLCRRCLEQFDTSGKSLA